MQLEKNLINNQYVKNHSSWFRLFIQIQYREYRIMWRIVNKASSVAYGSLIGSKCQNRTQYKWYVLSNTTHHFQGMLIIILSRFDKNFVIFIDRKKWKFISDFKKATHHVLNSMMGYIALPTILHKIMQVRHGYSKDSFYMQISPIDALLCQRKTQ